VSIAATPRSWLPRRRGEGGTSLRLVAIPGVFQPRSDTWMLVDAVRAHGLAPGARVLDLCTGSGAVAVAAALCGASVTAVDISRRARLSVALNARVNGVRVRALRGSLFAPVRGERFDPIVSNPPYLPAPDDALPRHGPARAWDAGRDGRALLDPLCAGAAAHLRPGGTVLVIHSELSDIDATVRALRGSGLTVDVPFEHEGTLGPLMRARADQLAASGLFAPGTERERVAIVRGRAAAGDEPSTREEPARLA
jgi:release factor glutamine methyltransferase